MIWFFGFFLALLGTGSEMELFYGGYGLGGQGIFFAFIQGLIDAHLFTLQGFRGVMQTLFSHPIYLFLFAIIGLIVLSVSLFIIWLTIVCQSALISSAIGLSKNRPIKWADALAGGLINFWKLFTLNLLLRAIVVVLFLLLGMFSIFKFMGSNIVYIVIFDLTITALIFTSLLTKFAVCGVILRNWDLKQSLTNAWQIIKDNWLTCLEISFLLFIIIAVANAFLGFFIGQLFYYAVKLFFSFKLGIYLTFLVVILIFLAAQIISTIFQWSSWAIIFELVTSKKTSLSSHIINFLNRSKK